MENQYHANVVKTLQQMKQYRDELSKVDIGMRDSKEFVIPNAIRIARERLSETLHWMNEGVLELTNIDQRLIVERNRAEARFKKEGTRE